MLLIAKPFKVGDYVATSGIEGTVQEISLLCTKIVTVDNKMIFVPNTEIATGKITNFSCEAMRRVDFKFKAGYNNDPLVVKQALQDAVDATKNILIDQGITIKISGYTEYAVEYTVRVWSNTVDYWTVYFDVLENVGNSYKNHNINGPVPGMNIYMQDK